MLKISRKVEYSLMVLKYLKIHSNEENLVSARQICDQFDIPFDTTSKVMQQLGVSGVLKSHQGARGGYCINGDLSRITYSELEEIIEGRDLTFDCNSNGCNLINKCNISGPIRRLGIMVNDFMKSITVGELLNDSVVQTTGQRT